MASSYAALVSLNNLIHTVLDHPNPPISLHPQQAEAFIQKITFLQDFLQLYSHRDDCPTDDLEILIRETACAAEDVIESYIVDRIGGSTNHRESSTHGDRFYQDLQKVVEDMGEIEQKPKEIEMASSYEVLVSLNKLIHTVLNHPNPSISLHQQQAEALIQKITFLQDFLQLYSHREDCPTDDLEILIRETATAAKDVIESYVDQIDRSTSHGESWWIFKICCKSSTKGDCFYEDLQKVVEDMDNIEQKAKEIAQKLGVDQDFQHLGLMSHTSPASPSLLLQSDVNMVESEDVFIDIIDKLTDKRLSRRIILPIVGMGGIGKTTLALKAFQHVTYDFDIRAWATISQKHNTRDILLEILCQVDKSSRETLSYMLEEELGSMIHKRFSGMRYLLVMDDTWGIEPWDEVKRFFPDNQNGSRIIITSRISNVAFELNGSCGYPMKLLDDNQSWCLLCNIVFRENGCPEELETIGKLIAKNCKGLPLSIVVMGGFLAKSIPTKQHWESVSRNF